MANRLARVAELRFPLSDVVFYGVVSSISTREMKIDVQALPGGLDLFQKGLKTDVTVLDENAIYKTVAEIAGLEEQHLILTLHEPIRRFPDRRSARRDCDNLVQARPIHPSGNVGAWITGQMRNISHGGMGLVLPQNAPLTEKMELSFLLTEKARSIRLSARLAHSHLEHGGLWHVGVEFVTVLPQDRFIINAFVHDAMPERIVRGSQPGASPNPSEKGD